MPPSIHFILGNSRQRAEILLRSLRTSRFAVAGPERRRCHQRRAARPHRQSRFPPGFLSRKKPSRPRSSAFAASRKRKSGGKTKPRWRSRRRAKPAWNGSWKRTTASARRLRNSRSGRPFPSIVGGVPESVGAHRGVCGGVQSVQPNANGSAVPRADRGNNEAKHGAEHESE